MRGSLRLATPHRIECTADADVALSHKGRGRSNARRNVIAMEDRNQVLCSRSEDFNEGIRAFLEKRKPVYIRR
ncbi:enoyl-CoA hydratase/carnithine racemase [Bradyrhizobium sp. AZCC 1614]